MVTIGSGTFEGCYKLKSISIPESVTSIGGNAFKGCESLTSINIPESVTSITKSALEDTQWLEEQRKANPLVIVNSILIDGATFADEEVIVPDSVVRIGAGAFRDCKEIK